MNIEFNAHGIEQAADGGFLGILSCICLVLIVFGSIKFNVRVFGMLDEKYLLERSLDNLELVEMFPEEQLNQLSCLKIDLKGTSVPVACKICLDEDVSTVFECGHGTCLNCSQQNSSMPYV